MTEFIIWLRATAMSQAFHNQAGWLWPLGETIHFIGLVLVLGFAGFFDLRLMGFMRRQVTIDAAHQFITWAKIGFALCLLTGFMFFVAEPHQYVVKSIWWWKVASLALAGGNAFLFEAVVSKGLVGLKPTDEPPFSAKLTGAVSLVAWLGVLAFGRLLPYIQPGINSNL